jgi:hypothetical protein
MGGRPGPPISGLRSAGTARRVRPYTPRARAEMAPSCRVGGRRRGRLSVEPDDWLDRENVPRRSWRCSPRWGGCTSFLLANAAALDRGAERVEVHDRRTQLATAAFPYQRKCLPQSNGPRRAPAGRPPAGRRHPRGHGLRGAFRRLNCDTSIHPADLLLALTLVPPSAGGARDGARPEPCHHSTSTTGRPADFPAAVGLPSPTVVARWALRGH